MGGGVRAMRLLVAALRGPGSVAALDGEGWTALLTAAHAEALGGALAARLADVPVPAAARRLLDRAADAAAASRQAALWEAEMARRALAPAGVVPVLLKGTAYAAAGLHAAAGRTIGDLDLLVPFDALGPAEASLRNAGWEPLKDDAYDDAYYRRWMHELPPLIHSTRDRIADVHHTILPPTARPKPDAAALLADAVAVPGGWRTLSPPDMVVHAAAHLIADGDLAGGLRNLWNIDRLVREFAQDPGFVPRLDARARHHRLGSEVARALRLANHLFGTPGGGRVRATDRLFLRRLLARDGWGRARRPGTRLAFYVRSHRLRMPPLLLARHLLVKARRRA